MPRKKREGITTPSRYVYKAIRVHGGTPPPELINQLGYLQEAARQAGVSPYRTAYLEAKAVLLRERIPAGQHGLYRGYCLELISKVQQRGILTLDELITMTVRKSGLDPNVLRLIAEEIGVEVPKEVPKPAVSAAKTG